MTTRHTFFAVLSTLLLVTAVAGCAPEPAAERADEAAPAASEAAGDRVVTVYSGRNERLVGPLFERFEQESGIEVRVRYGDTAELAATLLEEGRATPADVFVSQDAGALGAVSRAGLLRPLPEEVLGRAPVRFTGGEPATWVGLSGRARSVVYNTGAVTPEELPQSLEEVADPRYRGRFGLAPANGSFQAHMAVYRVVHGPEALDRLLAGLAANEPRRYDNNRAIVDAVVAGEADFGLVNHYYLWRALQENPEAPGANYFLPEGDASSFVNLAGAGVTSDRPEAVELVRFLLSDESQRYFAEETFEYPVVAGIEPAGELTPLDELRTPEVDFAEVADALEPTLEQIRRSGLMP